MMDPLAEPSTTYRSLKKGVIREGPEVTSEKVGNLAPGELFEVLEERVMEDGKKRFRMERGWVSMTAKSGLPLCVRNFLRRNDVLARMFTVEAAIVWSQADKVLRSPMT